MSFKLSFYFHLNTVVYQCYNKSDNLDLQLKEPLIPHLNMEKNDPRLENNGFSF